MATCSTQNTDITERATQQCTSGYIFNFSIASELYAFCRDYSSENLKYLTTEAALEDVAHFIAYQKSLDQFKNSKVSSILEILSDEIRIF